jgi:NTE family protein
MQMPGVVNFATSYRPLPMQRRHLLHFATATAAIGGAAALGACTFAPDYNHDADDAPRFDPTLVKPARMAWVLSSGGPRGFVHVGVLKALDELGCRPDLVVGGSVGALVGALYACGIRGVDLERMALDLGVTEMGRLAVTGEGRFAGTPIAELINRELRYRPIEKLPTPFAAVVVERTTRKPTLFNAGDGGVAVQASSAIEGLFTPVRVRGVQYVDADLAVPLPVRMTRALGAVKVLAIDASAHEDKAPESAQRYREGDLKKRALTEPDARSADMTLHPDFGYYVSVTREFRERAIRAGYEQTMAQSKRLKALHA